MNPGAYLCWDEVSSTWGLSLMAKESKQGVTILSYISYNQNRQTDRQTDKQILWHHIRGYVDFFFQLNLLAPYSLRSQGDYNSLKWNLTYWALSVKLQKRGCGILKLLQSTLILNTRGLFEENPLIKNCGITWERGRN